MFPLKVKFSNQIGAIDIVNAERHVHRIGLGFGSLARLTGLSRLARRACNIQFFKRKRNHFVAGLTLAGNYTYAYGRGLNEGGEWQNIERSIRHTATITGNYTHSWSDYTLNLNLNGRLQSKVYYPGDADCNAPGYGIWNLNTRHTFDGFRNFVIEPGIGIDNIFNKKDNRPLNKNFALYSPGRSVVISLALRLK